MASVPSGHVYVRHLSPVDSPRATPGPAVRRLADPDPDDPRRSAVSRWWPPAMLEPSWVRSHDEFDLFHLQFGFDARSPTQLSELAEALRDTDRPLVYTVHDLRNPHHTTPHEHDAQLDVLIPAADALITLTPGAAAEIERRWGRTATVLPHPHVVDFETMAAVQERRATGGGGRQAGAFRVGVHVKSLRASMNPLPVIRVLTETLRGIPGAVLQVDGHSDVLLPSGPRHSAELADFLTTASDQGLIDLRVHDYFSDAELWDYLSSLDVSVLPYRFGTHSGWLEACRDLGTTVLAPSCGYYREQGPVFEYGNDDDGFDAASLAAAVHAAHAAGPAVPATVAERRMQRRQVSAAHAQLYAGLLASAPTASGPLA
ncbi:glycosyltransferase family 1 protein [Herbiconiux sp.]|uniref:glycosyltransferase family 1 protein n=1 Tax=Herbiconiux sp. TaxID=1871186 RepID=UPI0025B9BBC4|nr:glycosyltransferase family 1 protein [Herbiconiux sp.]